VGDNLKKYTMKKLIFTMVLFASSQIYAQIGVEWVRNYGGPSTDRLLNADFNSTTNIIMTLGDTGSSSGDVHGNTAGSTAIWITKMIPNGDTIWTRCYNNSLLINPFGKIKATNDLGFIVFGGGNTIKFDGNGDQQWNLNAGCADLIENSDGSFYLLGNTEILKVSSNGVFQPSIPIGSNLYEPIKLIRTNDNGFLVGSQEYGQDGIRFIKLVKLSSTGVVQWNRTYGESTFSYQDYGSYLSEIKQLANDEYIVSATSGVDTPGTDVIGNHGQKDVWVFKIDVLGNFVWNKCFGSSQDEILRGLDVNSNNEVVFTATCNSSVPNGDFLTNRVLNEKDPNYAFRGTWIVKLSSDGSLLWQGTYGYGLSSNSPYALKLNDNNIFVFGTSSSSQGNNDENNGSTDSWIIKFKPCSSITIPTISLSPNIVNCSGYTSQLETINTLNTTYQWYKQNNTSGILANIQNQTNYFLNNTSEIVFNGLANYVVLTVVDHCPAISLPFTFEPIYIAPPLNQNICIVGVNPSTGKNKVVWEKEQTQVIEEYKIYRENTQSGSFDLIGTTNYSDSSVFEDALSNTSQQAYRYQIKYVDTCGNESSVGDTHKTLHLTINQGVGNTWNLIWTAYEGVSFPSYNIYRGTNSSNMTLINTVASNITSYTDNNAPSGFVYYQIEILGPNCTPTKLPYNNSKSNISTNDPSYLGINENLNNQISIAPNPTTNLTTLSVSQEFIGKSFSIADFAGRIVLHGKIQSMNQTIELQRVARGSYFLTVDNTNIPGFKIIKE
jgi:hypothetical protein